MTKAQAGRKGGRSRSASKAAAARANGEKRVRDRLPDEVISRLRTIPESTAARRRWLVTWAAEVLIGEASGTIPPELAAKLRVGIAHVQKLLPARATGDDAGDDEDDDEDEGPALERDAGDADAVRVDA